MKQSKKVSFAKFGVVGWLIINDFSALSVSDIAFRVAYSTILFLYFDLYRRKCDVSGYIVSIWRVRDKGVTSTNYGTGFMCYNFDRRHLGFKVQPNNKYDVLSKVIQKVKINDSKSSF